MKKKSKFLIENLRFLFNTKQHRTTDFFNIFQPAWFEGYTFLFIAPVHSKIEERPPVFSLAFFSMAGHHAVNLGRYAVLQVATLSFEQRGR